MVKALGYQNDVFMHRINQPIFLIFTPGPKSGQITFQRLRLPDFLKRGPLDLSLELVDSFERGPVPQLPEQVVFPGVIRVI